MKLNATTRRPGLILLVVLGMLGLFSLLAVTYVLFSGHSRSASVALARSEIRGNKSQHPVFDEAIKQLIRGTVDPRSALYGHDLLGDLNGTQESLRPITAFVPDMSLGQLRRPVLIGSELNASQERRDFLRIPLAASTGTILPSDHDALTGRIVTFPNGQGPLSGHSFRVIRYLGAIDAAEPAAIRAQQFSITIDLGDIDLSQQYSQIDQETGRSVSLTLGEWAVQQAGGIVNRSAGVPWTEGVYLCYRRVTNGGLFDGYTMFFNPAPLNSHGVGIFNNGDTQMHSLPSGSELPVAFQHRYQDLISSNRLDESDSDRAPGSFGNTIYGDTDEPYDAPDYQNMFLAARDSNALAAEDIIPSFHRAALINYIVNMKPLPTYTEQDLLDTVERIRLAVGRPLSIDITMPASFRSVRTNPSFTGSNPGSATAVPQLTLRINNWNDWPGQPLTDFRRWLNFLTTGPWDVDNDGDGITDSVWADLGLPLQISAEGKLLKALVAFYVDDLDSRIDVNAASSARHTSGLLNTSFSRRTEFLPAASGVAQTYPFSDAPNQWLPQGLGYGSADISFRHLFAKPGLNWGGLSPEEAYDAIMVNRYRPNPGSNDFTPAAEQLEPLSFLNRPLPFLNMRERRLFHRHGLLPGLPSAYDGRASYTLDRLGNPMVWNVMTQPGDAIPIHNPYEARLIGARHQDSPFTLAEWERIYRVADSDRTSLPARLQERLGETETTLATSTAKYETTPYSRHLRVPKLAVKSRNREPLQSPRSFREMVNAIRTLKGQDSIEDDFFQVLFPLEFARGLPLNLNRPFGDGFDNDDDGEIDEPSELVGFAQDVRYANGVITGVMEDYFHGKDPSTIGVEHPEISTSPYPSGNETRQFFARHLYCLAQLIVPQDYCFPNIDRVYYQSLVTQALRVPNGPEAVKLRELRGRTLAQWAINVVDFRDSDAVMTRFPYDSDPFRSPDGSGVDFNWTPNAVVWGLEQPELLLTESLATHDIRIRKDRRPDPPRFNQFRTPEGSLFLELYCPRTTAVNVGTGRADDSQVFPGVPSSLYTKNLAGDVFLDVSKLSPPNPNGDEFPVWRVYISGPVEDRNASTPEHKTPHQRLVAPNATSINQPSRNDLTLQLPYSNILAADFGATDLVRLDRFRRTSGLVFDHATVDRLPDPEPEEARIIVFTQNTLFTPTNTNCPGVSNAAVQVYTNRNNPVLLHGNQYLVVGPRDVTYFGSRAEAGQGALPINAPSRHRIDLRTSWADLYAVDGTLTRDNQSPNFPLRDAFVMQAAVAAPPSWPVNSRIGINVSAPHPIDPIFYDAPTARVNSENEDADDETGADGFADLPADGYHDYRLDPRPGERDPMDDSERQGPLLHWGSNLADNESSTTVANNVVQPGTILDWSTAYLQRLADPDRPWHGTFNPYITVDWLPIDLTVFSGEESGDDRELDPPPIGSVGSMRFGSRQKVGSALNARTQTFDVDVNTTPPTAGQTFISSLSAPAEELTSRRGARRPVDMEPFFGYEMPFDWGPAQPDRPATIRPARDPSVAPFCTLGFLNSHFVIAAESTFVPPLLVNELQGAPGDPSRPNAQWRPASLFWANRSFVNSLELAYVPLSAPGQLMQEFSATEVAGEIYGQATSNPNTFYPHSHLLDFFRAVTELPLAPGRQNTPLGLLFDLVETPSPWLDANKLVPPTHLTEKPLTGRDPAVVAAHDVVLSPLRAPYNSISRFVEPGRINLNTIPNQPIDPANAGQFLGSPVFKGLWASLLPPAERAMEPLPNDRVSRAWSSLQHSRRGYIPDVPAADGFYYPPTARPKFNKNYPTQFAGVFKPISEAGMVPQTRDLPGLDANSRINPVNVTLVRAAPDLSDPREFRFSTTQPLFDDPRPQLDGSSRTHFETGVQRNVFTDLYQISRMQNLTTDRSNVFAVYVTVGLFEYDANTSSIGMEYGADSGTTKRSKAFYVIDRSVPVGYQVGQDHNVEKTIILRRYLNN